ncbi:hypothetical protein BJ973_000157 [Actinoplanes tereljensis]|uniref:CopC domain-containing protein n=1 Tax=Paractinoplanes tereljensis TaxID=571912 RepID=A0A919U0C7_9ACTN|nr:hypothetical protein [Actinoplanes tereljensis]GIF26752.1 hypothetical protein Ate02nite_94820 [Actinoplanes tereljensis]
MRKALFSLLTAGILILLTGSPALAYQPVNIVHTEHVQAGPYGITVGFSVWPLRAMQSLDFTFVPDEGIVGKSGTLLRSGPAIRGRNRAAPLVRHPRRLDVWGLDVESLNAPGTYTFTFTVAGAKGTGKGSLTGLTVLAQPGPPMGLSWAICAIPSAAMIIFLVLTWRRVHPSRNLLPLAMT